AFGQQPERLEIAGAQIVVFEEISADSELIEQCVGDRVVADIGLPARILTAADMDRGIELGRRASNRAVDDVDIDSQQILPIIAAVLEQLPRPRIAELYQRGLVDLHIAAAGIV